jgi:serine/threonine-protein kinase
MMTGDDPDRTIYSPGSGFTPGEGPSAPSAPPTPSTPPAMPPPLPAGGAQAIKVGDVLNSLYEVRRHIARGGMGEVFEGANVNYAEERVAIKVILPHLAADPAVQGMFYKEARTLTRLTHPALVQYRTMAQEPQLGVFYIVTEFVDGPNLSDRLKDIDASPKQIASLTRRLAEGLAVAHSMGAIHRDISPDNILLEGGSVDKAKIIDFGIAKDLDPTAATIVGDGFAGKLNYVAPEQLGEFGREIGPWTDIYSLGLTILAVTRGRDVDMGGTIVDAVDKRRAGPDLSPVPDTLRPLIERMVAANPQNRMRSMEEVVQWIGDWSQGKTTTPPTSSTPGKPVSEKLGAGLDAIKTAAAKLRIPPFLKEPRGMAIAGGGALGLLVLVAIVLSFTGGSSDKGAGGVAGGTDSKTAATLADPLATTRNVLAGGLAKVPCSWLDVEGVDGGNGAPVSVSLKGVSGQSTQAIAQIEQMLKSAGIGAVSMNYADIAPVPATFCGPLQAFGQVRGSGIAELTVPQVKFEMAPLQGDLQKEFLGQLGAKAVINIDMKGSPQKAALVGIAESGEMGLIRADFRTLDKAFLDDLGGQRYRLNLPTTFSGWQGIILVVGDGPFDPALFNHSAGALSPDWSQRFLSAATKHGWKVETVWYKAVNEQPDNRPSPTAVPAQSPAPQR